MSRDGRSARNLRGKAGTETHHGTLLRCERKGLVVEVSCDAQGPSASFFFVQRVFFSFLMSDGTIPNRRTRMNYRRINKNIERGKIG